MSSGFAKGNTVRCTVTPNDGTVSGAADYDTVGILNSAPSVSSVTVSPSSPVYGSTLTAGYSTSDPDGDSVSVSTAWLVNGTQVSTASSIAVASYAVKGDSVAVRLTPTDGAASGSAVTSSARTIGNTAPTAPSLSITASPTEGVDDILCVIDTAATDVDVADTITYQFTWEADTLVYPDDFPSALGPDHTTWADDTVPAADTLLATDWTCTVSAYDGTTSGAAADATTSTIGPTAYYGPGATATGGYGLHGGGYLLGQTVTLSSPITLTGFGVHLYSGSSGIQFGLYTDSGGVPGTLVAQAPATSVVAGLNEVAVTGGSVSLAAGTYWLLKIVPATTYITENSSGSVLTYYRAYPYNTTLPTTFGGTSSYNDQTIATWLIGY